LKFWFEQTKPDQWFEKDPTFDAIIRERFLGLHEFCICRSSIQRIASRKLARSR